ncbi:DUF2569 domain-containing protein [Providencia stuartii]|nr:DUF2569 domain-containing protein [Providencia stuartii]
MKTEDRSSSHNPPASPKPKPELTGIGGWLILPMLGIVLSVIILPFAIYGQNIQVIEYWDELTNSQSDTFIPLFKELIYFELLGNAILYTLLLFLCYVFFTKKKLTIKIYIFFQLFALVLTISDIILAGVLLDLEVEASDIRDIFRALIGCAIWIPYFLVSKRVKNTFVN